MNITATETAVQITCGIINASEAFNIEDLEENADEDEGYSYTDIKLAIGRELMNLYDLWSNY